MTTEEALMSFHIIWVNRKDRKQTNLKTLIKLLMYQFIAYVSTEK